MKLLIAFVIVLSACGDNSPTTEEATCGDGLVEGSEQCDDGNAIDNDDCSNACRVPGCGDGIVNFTEACDDGNDVDGDGCDANCTQSFCGNGVKAGDETCDDGNTASGDGCDANCKVTACGNGVMTVGEACDDGNAVEGDGCDSNCKASGCGNGIKGGMEECDDGNMTSADGCSATCATETAEIEPNDDGTISTGASGISGNDFSITAPDTNGAITNSATIIAKIDPAGDEDIFKLTNTDTVPARVKIDTWNLAATFGIGMSCGSSIDTGIQVKNAAGTVLASNDNRTTTDKCAGLVYALFPGETVYVQVVEFGDNAAITSYALDIGFEPVICGDGAVGPGEQCDDMNATPGDGCSMTCQIEGAVNEIEPNEDGSPSQGGSGTTGNDFGTANPLNNGLLAGDFTLIGAISPLGDEDIYGFTNLRPNPVKVQFDIWGLSDGLGIGTPCGTIIDTGLVIRDAAGGSLAVNDDRNGAADRCSTLAFNLLPGETRFAHVVEFGDNALITKYALVVKYTDVICGDSMIGVGETCDDGNMTNGDGCSSVCQIEPFCGDNIFQPAEFCEDGNMANGDGCSSTCQVEGAVTEIEPNEDGSVSTGGTFDQGNDFASANADANGAFTTSTRIQARIRPVGDEDVFAFTNPLTIAITAQFDVWRNGPGFGIGVSCGTGTGSDSYMRIRDAAGTSLASNDDRASGDFCSKIIFGILPGETVYAHVFYRGDGTEIPSYTLDVVYTPVPCGDGVIGFNEQCDDANPNSGDGCSNSCQLENTFTETEPNDDGTVATGATGITGNDFSSAAANGPFTTSKRIIAKLGVAGDEDVFAITNPSATGGMQVRFDIWNLAAGKGFGIPCGTTIDTGIQLRNATGTSLASNDDRNGASDRCSGLTFTMAPSQTIYAHVVESGDNAAIPSTGTGPGYVLDVVFTPIICGDGFVGPTEQCDDMNTTSGDGCSATCQWEVVCGNGVLQAGEQCDDANTQNNDGCSATCTIEALVSEVEPNNTLSDATANAVQIIGSATVSGAITPSGDVDRYRLMVATATTVRFEVFTTFGDCSTATIDLRLFDSSGNALNADLAGSGINECGAIVMFLPAGTYFAQVEERGNNATVAAYQLQISYQNNGGTETEPNETLVQASTNIGGNQERYVFGDHMTFGDVDVYSVTVPPNGHLRAEIIEGNTTETCESGGIDSRLSLFDDTGALLTEDNDTGRGLCSLIDGTGTTPLDPTARNTSLTAKTYFLMVRASAFATMSGGQFAYRLQVTVR